MTENRIENHPRQKNVRCGVDNGPANRFAGGGRAAGGRGRRPPGAKVDANETLTLQPVFSSHATPESRSVPIDMLFSYKNKLVVGRLPTVTFTCHTRSFPAITRC